jgi:hypothetical protein
MTRKDYIKFAEVIKTAKAHIKAHECNIPSDEIVEKVAVDLAYVFKQDNPKFDMERFFKACELEVK